MSYTWRTRTRPGKPPKICVTGDSSPDLFIHRLALHSVPQSPFRFSYLTALSGTWTGTGGQKAAQNGAREYERHEERPLHGERLCSVFVQKVQSELSVYRVSTKSLKNASSFITLAFYADVDVLSNVRKRWCQVHLSVISSS